MRRNRPVNHASDPSAARQAPAFGTPAWRHDRGGAKTGSQSMIRKSVKRFSGKIMLGQRTKALRS
jgi:hypothetical protein